MRQIEVVIADLSKVASGAWKKEPLNWSPEEAVDNRFTAAINGYVNSYNEACHILGITRGDKFTGLPQDERRRIVFGLSQQCAKDRYGFVTHFEENELKDLYQQFLTGDRTRWGKYVVALQAATDWHWNIFTDIPQELQVELPKHWGHEQWKPENIALQLRFARHLGILGVEQEFGDLEKDARVVTTIREGKDLFRKFQKQQPNLVWAMTMPDWNPYSGYMLYHGEPCYFMNFPTIYGENIRALVKLKPNDLKYLDRLSAMSINDAIRSELACPTITLEIDPKLVLPE